MHSETEFQFAPQYSTEFLPKGGKITVRSWRMIGVDLFRIKPHYIEPDEIKDRIRMALFTPNKPLHEISVEISDEEIVAYTTSGKSGCILKWLPRL